MLHDGVRLPAAVLFPSCDCTNFKAVLNVPRDLVYPCAFTNITEVVLHAFIINGRPILLYSVGIAK